MFRRLLLGVFKGLLVGGALGALLHYGLGVEHLAGGVLSYLLYGAIGVMAGIVAGQPPWREGAWVASILKGLVGFGIGAGLYWVAQRFLTMPLPIPALLPANTTLAEAPLLFAPAVATVYATLVELDDGGEATVGTKSAGVRVSAMSGDDEDDAAEEAAVEKKPSASVGARGKR